MREVLQDLIAQQLQHSLAFCCNLQLIAANDGVTSSFIAAPCFMLQPVLCFKF